jgi:glycerol-3-phosphate dehydrogenase (NAD(P)+)
VFPPQLQVVADIAAFPAGAPVLLAVPMQQLRAMLGHYGAVLAGRPLVACCKGIELNTGLGPVALVTSLLPATPVALLTGPSFAADIAHGLPTALTLACADPQVGQVLQLALTTPTLRIYRTTDTIGAELGGALKNVIAIAAGAGLGDSARAALMTRGYAEMVRLAGALGAAPETLAGLSGFGDLVLTCTSTQSRNYRFGMALGRGDAFDPAVTVEGAATARAAVARAAALGVELPITTAVVGMIDGQLSLRQAMESLLSRPLKKE